VWGVPGGGGERQGGLTPDPGTVFGSGATGNGMVLSVMVKRATERGVWLYIRAMRSARSLVVFAVAALSMLRSAGAQELAPDSLVRAIHQDAQGALWIGTQNDGVYRDDGHGLTRFTRENGLANDQVRDILEDRDGTVWIVTAEGVSRWADGALQTVNGREYSSVDDWRPGPDDLWFKGDKSSGYTRQEGAPGVYRSDGETIRYHAFPAEALRRDEDLYSVTRIARGRGGRIWIATYAAVFGFDGDGFTVIDDESLGYTPETGLLHVRSVYEDSKGRLWIGNNWIGLLMRVGGTTINVTDALGKDQIDPDGEPQPFRVFSIGEDRDGNIWFGTVDRGVWRYDGESLRQYTEKDGLETTGVFAITTDRNGDLLVGGNGVFRFDGTRFERLY